MTSSKQVDDPVRSTSRSRTDTRPPARAPIAAGLIAGALVPAAAAAALFVSLALRRPLLAVRTNNPTSAIHLTVAWALALVAVAAIQLGGSLLGMARDVPTQPTPRNTQSPLIEPESSHDPKQRTASSVSNPGRPRCAAHPA
jgi:hypothetical protein